ncbi:flavin monoamine oxidase family protein [Sphingobium sp. EP60837]|uniref:flavin monoamine oxidase family protein n=1 Tax=Sphingobium sp. EP60837 TaxID=1855519 RepID=UPI0007DD17C4|nr:FAD-dependent oxidoreductase [Sphingobium sp. EP60837]ANI79250.1 Monoamine oxidase [Sphingobium sp. EP60837]
MPDTQKPSIHQNVNRRTALLTFGMGAAVTGAAGRASTGKRQSAGGNESPLDIAILGAGLSGLTSARDLLRAGCDSFILFEARERVGGRTCNHDIGNGVISEGGGQWIGPGQTAIADLARELGVETFESFFRGKTVYLVGDERITQDVGTGGLGSHNSTIAKLNEMARNVPSEAPWTAPDANDLDRQSLADWLSTNTLTEEERLTFSLSASLTYGAPPENLSLLHYLTLINSAKCDLEKLEAMAGGAQEKRFVGGSYILSAKMADQLEGHIRLSSPVRRIVGWDRDIVQIHTDSGTVHARQLILAMSPSLCNQIQFDPPLPADRCRLQQSWPTTARMRKAVHVYSRPFWRDKDLNGQIIQVDGPVVWSADNSPPDGSVGIITAFVREGSLPTDERNASAALSTIYAKALGDEALQPRQYHEIDWGTDPWSLSCTSPYPPGFLTRWGKIMREPTGRLIWSGTDMAQLWPSSMDGAVRAGHAAALQALRALVNS